MLVATISYRINAGQEQHYQEVAEWIHPQASDIDGFLSVQRFESASEPGTWLSLSYWRDQEALAAWREHTNHAKVMKVGRDEIFSEYRIVIAEVTRDYSVPGGAFSELTDN